MLNKDYAQYNFDSNTFRTLPMSSAEISRFIVEEDAPFNEVYTRFTFKNEYDILLVVNKIGGLTGIVGVKELITAANRNDYYALKAIDIAQNQFTFVYDDEGYRNRCLELLYNNDFNCVPIISRDSNAPVDLIHRRKLQEFKMISFSQLGEDIILNNVLRDVEEIFYIDVGAYDPWDDSVTNWFYLLGGRGINIEPQNNNYQNFLRFRPNDINIMTAVADYEGELEMYAYQGSTTGVYDFAIDKSVSFTTTTTTLKKICEKNIPRGQDIHLLKIDVEGFEKQVLLGADFNIHRPWVIVIESTKPHTMIPTHNEWEDIIIKNGYSFCKQYEINRFYVANEHMKLSDRFIDMEALTKRFMVGRSG